MQMHPSMAMLNHQVPAWCFQCESCGVSGPGTSLIRSMVDAVLANPHRAGVNHESWSSPTRPVTGIMPPWKTSCDMIAITSSGMICSLDLAKAESARPTIAAATQQADMSTNSSMLRLGIIEPLVTAPGPHFLPQMLMAVTMLDCRIANAAKTMTFAKRYAVVDNPTACSRRKMARSPIRARIVSAVPMKIAPTLSNTRIWPGSFGAAPPWIAGTGTPKPTSPGTDSDSTPMMNGRNARKMKYPRSETISLICRREIVENCRGTLVFVGLPRSPGVCAGGCGGVGPVWAMYRCQAASGSRATPLKMSAQFVVPIAAPISLGGPQNAVLPPGASSSTWSQTSR